jgi:hypothetical protein
MMDYLEQYAYYGYAKRIAEHDRDAVGSCALNCQVRVPTVFRVALGMDAVSLMFWNFHCSFEYSSFFCDFLYGHNGRR